MTILDKIIATKEKEVFQQKQLVSVEELKNAPLFARKCNSLAKNLLKEGASGIIAEFKQKSPSKGIINDHSTVVEVTAGYKLAGASGISVLTDKEYFGGCLENLQKARKANPEMPILRKDFMINDYQIIEAKAHGADVILLIAACLEKHNLEQLAKTAKGLGLEVLVEVHNAEELEKLNDFVDIVGVNNRNLKTFDVSISRSQELEPLIPDSFVKISESGLSDPESIKTLRKSGFKGFLIGETFMKTKDPAKACKDFILSIPK